MYLNCHSYYSLRYGTLSPEQLVQEAKARGITSLALTDIHRSSGVFDFVQACQQEGIKPVVGMEFEAGYVCLARNEHGFLQINDFATKYLVSKEPWPERPPVLDDVWTIYPLAMRKKIKTLTGPRERWGVRASDRNLLWKEKDLRDFVWCQPFTFLDQRGFSMHRLLRAIDLNT